jgi:hypothetical protein
VPFPGQHHRRRRCELAASRTMPTTSLRAAVCAALAACALGAATADAAPPKLTPLTASVLAPPEAVVGTDHRRHVVYEVMLRNTDQTRLDVQSLAVRAGGGRTLRRYDGAQIAKLMTTVEGPTVSLSPGQSGTLWIDLALRRDAPVPRALVHRLKVLLTASNGETLTARYLVARTRVSHRRALSIAAPLHGGPYLNFNGCCGLSPHRTAIAPVDGVPYLSERYASDFIRIDADGNGAAGDLTKNESFFTYGERVYAVADARVVAIRNDLPENAPLVELPGSAFTLQTIVGNRVVLALPDGRYATYSHLKPGSVRVRPGQRVRRGQVLARVGNTGQAGAPHLHFQLSDGTDPLASNGVPYVFDRFMLRGAATNVDEFLMGTPADVETTPGPAKRRHELPLHANVVRFPG